MAELFVSDEQLKALVADSLAAAIPADERDRLFKEALTSIMEKRRDSYGGRSRASILQEAFSLEVEVLARAEVHRIFDEDIDTRDKVKHAVADALNQALDAGLSGKMARAIAMTFEER